MRSKDHPKLRRHTADAMELGKVLGGYTHSPFDGLKLPKRGFVNRPCLTPQQAKEIIRLASEPFRTMFWIVAETGMRGLCAIRGGCRFAA